MIVRLIARRLFSALLIMLSVSFILFLLFEADKYSVSRKVLGPFATDEQREIWIEKNGYNEPFASRYFDWITNAAVGDFGTSLSLKTEVGPIVADRLGNSAILAGFMFLFMIPIALILGVLAGINEGKPIDRGISVFAILTTSIPEFASATFLTAVFVFGLNWLPGTSSFSNGFSFKELVLPVAVLVIYDFGYIGRLTRASMAEVMTSHYVRTAILKGLPYRTVVFKHALRNALIAPFTAIVVQLNWLLSGVIVVEVFFAYKGFGKTLYDAALFGDVYLVEACTMVAVLVAVMSQLVSDIGYTFLNPKIRFQ